MIPPTNTLPADLMLQKVKNGRQALENWKQLPSDAGAVFDNSVQVDVEHLEPMITFGTNPGMGIPITAPNPRPINANRCWSSGPLLRKPWLIWISNRVCLYWVIRWMWSSSAAAPMAGSVICVGRRIHDERTQNCRRNCGCWLCPARRK